ncbi:hypothetical protein HCN51_31615 [Nonomuraea sp. FMUSA5-5]|uniref:Uncharacterized protein n=1 Tax=Nonomuraea composti TaxID=2720023 RepID=A0ABX1BFN7_9ACTN|nr:hypothetical protein [Nonomuraea sp. FMUSA5-5]NJP93933.1 hypothetical protein [Nonomuraea sp. FMUSA5-5]
MADTESHFNTLASLIVSLQEHIDRRAAEIAGPRIAKAARLADEKIADARREQERAEDLVAELRRQITSLERQLDRYRQENAQDKATIRRVRALTRLGECPASYDDNVTECQRVVACSWEEAYWREAMAHVDAALAVPESAPPG